MCLLKNIRMNVLTKHCVLISNFGQHDNKKLKTNAIIISFIMYLLYIQ